MTDPTTDGDYGGNTPSLPAQLSTRIREKVRTLEDWLVSDSSKGDVDTDTDTDTDTQNQATRNDPDNGDPGEIERKPLLTDEERILRTLESSGRIRQSELVSGLDWSKGKTSRVLSSMEAADEVCRTQVGREKIVMLPEQQFDAADSSSPSAEEPALVSR